MRLFPRPLAGMLVQHTLMLKRPAGAQCEPMRVGDEEKSVKQLLSDLTRGTILVAAIASTAACRSSPQAEIPEPKDGAALFLTLCASCHGELGRGDGPVASLLVYSPPDLTLIAQRNSGFFPAIEVERVIDGRTGRAVHGTRNMPVWGNQLFFSADPNDAKARARADEAIRLLSEHIRSIQQPR